MLSSLQFPVAVVAYDAGAANHIIAWFKNVDHEQINVCLKGPALKQWMRAFRDTPVDQLTDAVAKSRTLISGTGWASSLEHDSRKIARQLGIKSIAVIDHWTNYRERFVRDGEEVLPDAVWVVDAYAKALAESAFTNIKVDQLPNLYLDNMVQEIRRYEHTPINPVQGRNLLYVLEPMRQAWGSPYEASEFKALDFLMMNLDILQLGASLTIRLRPHPSDPIGKYDRWVEAQKSAHISLDSSPALAESIAWADVVVGCQTYAMVVALAAGKRVISSIPPWAPPCVLPQVEIIKLSDLLKKSLAGM